MKPPMEAIFAYLMMPEPRQTCLGCSALLHEMGKLVVVDEHPLDIENKPVINGLPGEFSAIYYGFAEGVTLAECRAIIKERHVGPPEWGG